MSTKVIMTLFVIAVIIVGNINIWQESAPNNYASEISRILAPASIEKTGLLSPKLLASDSAIKGAPTATVSPSARHQRLEQQSGCMTFERNPCGVINVFGRAKNISSIVVALARKEYDGAKDFETISKASVGLDTTPIVKQLILVSANSWSAKFKGAAGTYIVFIYDGTNRYLLVEDRIEVTY